MLTLEHLDVKTRDYVPMQTTHCIRGLGYNGEINFAACRTCPFYIPDRRHGWQILNMQILERERVDDDDDCDYALPFSSDRIVFQCPVCGERIRYCGQLVNLGSNHDEIRCDACGVTMTCVWRDDTPRGHVAVAVPLSTGPQITILQNDL